MEGKLGKRVQGSRVSKVRPKRGSRRGEVGKVKREEVGGSKKKQGKSIEARDRGVCK